MKGRGKLPNEEEEEEEEEEERRATASFLSVDAAGHGSLRGEKSGECQGADEIENPVSLLSFTFR